VEGQARPPRGRTRGPASSMLPARAAACSSTRHARSYRAGTPRHSPSRPGASARAARSAPARAAPKPAGEMNLRRPSASCARSSRITGCGAHRVLPWVFAFKELRRASGRMVQALFSDGLRKVPGGRVVKSLIRQRRVPRARREAQRTAARKTGGWKNDRRVGACRVPASFSGKGFKSALAAVHLASASTHTLAPQMENTAVIRTPRSWCNQANAVGHRN
jgi:hypothetical protein